MSIKTRRGHCGECRWFHPWEKRDAHWNDGECRHPTRNGKNRKTPYKCYSHAAACFDAEDPEENRQLTIEEVFNNE